MPSTIFTNPLGDGYGHGYDLATGKLVNIRKPEEAVRQEYERVLHEDFGYEYSQMDIEVRIQRGSKTTESKHEKDRADIVIYKTSDLSKRDQHRDIIGIVETKSPNRTTGVKQLMSYMSASSCEWGVWTNGPEIEYLYKDHKTGEILRDFIFQIPRNGETVEDMGRITKDFLIPARDLKIIFNRILQTLYANTNISRREKLGSEMIRLIFAKIWDEHYHPNQLPKFRISLGEDPESVKERIQGLFIEVKKELVEDGVFDKNEEITLEPKSVMWVVGQLERYSLLRTDKDVVGAAFEVFAESKLVGEKGEFFTPREVVKTAVALINPQPEQRILDPACGSGGFLIYALEHVWNEMERNPKYRGIPDLAILKQRVAEKYFYGIDKETDLVKIAKAYMAIVGDGRGGIVQQNSLHLANEFEGRARELFVDGDHFRQFDLIMTNPPFGSKIKVLKDEAASFDLGHSWRRKGDIYEKTDKAKNTEPQILFIERCLEMLRGGGLLAIVLPETFFHATNSKYIMQYLKTGNNIKAVIDLPHNTFRPHNNAKTLLLILQKGHPQQEQILMAVAEEMGHDHLGRVIYRYDKEAGVFTDKVWDDMEFVREEIKDPHNPQNGYVFIISADSILDDIYVPRYYWPKIKKDFEKEAKRFSLEFVEIKQLVNEGILETFPGHGSPPSKFKGKGEIPYVRVADIVNWEIYKNPTSMVPEHIYKKIKGEGVDLVAGDILFVRRGSYRIGTVAMVSPFDTEVLLTKEFVVMRIVKPENEYNIDSYYLLYLLSHELTQSQLSQKIFLETTLPNIGDRWQELKLPVHKDRDEAKKVSSKIRAAFDAKTVAQKQIGELRAEYGGLTT